jgi:hypothetical protein
VQEDRSLYYTQYQLKVMYRRSDDKKVVWIKTEVVGEASEVGMRQKDFHLKSLEATDFDRKH